MSAVILIAIDILSNTTESEKTNKLFDDPELDVHLKMLLTNHDAGHVVSLCKRSPSFVNVYRKNTKRYRLHV